VGAEPFLGPRRMGMEGNLIVAAGAECLGVQEKSQASIQCEGIGDGAHPGPREGVCQKSSAGVAL
jgi:hypothetical protein